MSARRAFLWALLAAARGVLGGNYTVLNNTRCVNDVGQWPNAGAWSACEALCMANADAPLFSYCAPGPAAPSCPAATATCWCYPMSVFVDGFCSAAEGWVSAYVLEPPVAPPADWLPRIAAGDMVFTGAPAAEVGAGYFPVVANGFVGFEVGPFTQLFENAWPWRDAGSLKLQGVYSGYNFASPSHRAQIPKVSDLTLLRPAGANLTAQGCAIDYKRGVYYNRTLVVSGLPGCADNTVIEQRSYAHRRLRELFVFEVLAFSASHDPAWAGCTLPVVWAITPNSTTLALNDLVLGESLVGDAAVWSGTTVLPEEVGLPLRKVAVVFDAWVAVGPSSLSFTSAAPQLSVRAVLRSDLDVAGAQTPADVASAALSTWRNYSALDKLALLQGHEAAMSELWASGVEIAGNASFAATVNSSLYDIVSSLRADMNWSTSPGGLATGGYAGHHFWDMETWMFPVLTTLYPDLARVAAQYRLDRLGASLVNAQLMGYDGAKFAWESASTGLWASPWRGADFSEDHLNADVPLAWRKHYYTSGDKAWLASAWPHLNETCRFWACRFQRTDSKGPAPPGYAANCSSKDGVGNYTVHAVIPPDESRDVINDSAYTNAAGAQTLAWCIEAAGELGIASIALPPLWSEIAASPYLPLDDTLYAGGPVHRQNTGYTGQKINQADVALLQFPLGLDFGVEQNQRDLDYYATVTDFAGMFTGDSSYSCAYLALGNRTAADAQLNLAFNHIEGHFDVFHETAFDNGHTQHFITGNGGYLQGFVFGFTGMRIARVGVMSYSSQAPTLPPFGTTSLKLRGVHLLGTAYDFYYDATQICVSLQAGGSSGGAALELRVVATGERLPLQAVATCVAVQAVDVAGVGFK